MWKALIDESSTGGVPEYIIAVKTVRDLDGEAATDLLKEAAVMSQVTSHPHVLPLVGVVTAGAPLLLLTPFCEHGSLLSFLRAPPASLLVPTEQTLLGFAHDIAAGMAHLHDGKFVHRDLAARNVLVTTQLVCKISDFGLTRLTTRAHRADTDDQPGAEHHYYRSEASVFSVRWTPPESMTTGVFNEASDCWSYGVVLAEIFSGGAKPYGDLSNTAVGTSPP